MVFGGNDHGPGGGMKDFSCSFDDLESAEEWALNLSRHMDWAHIYDLEHRKCVAEFERA
jgi:hypothetical protein